MTQNTDLNSSLESEIRTVCIAVGFTFSFYDAKLLNILAHKAAAVFNLLVFTSVEYNLLLCHGWYYTGMYCFKLFAAI